MYAGALSCAKVKILGHGKVFYEDFFLFSIFLQYFNEIVVRCYRFALRNESEVIVLPQGMK